MPRTKERSIPELRKAERGEVRSAFGRLGVALVFPNTYSLGMSNLAVHALYRLINAHPAFWCDRAFVWHDGRAVAMETGRSLADFDVVAFSIAYELDELDAVELLRRAGIPPRAADRDARRPLVVCGGVAPSLNPEPMAPFVDLFLLGEVEATLPALLHAIADAPDRDALFDRAAGIGGCYVPSRDEAAPARARVLDLEAHPTTSAVITPYTEFADCFLVEVSRGCSRACRFCATRGLYGPARTRSADSILESVRGGMRLTDRVGLVGAAVADHPEADRLFEALPQMGAKVSVSSSQVDRITEALLRCLAASGQRTVTIAPETGSEGPRRTLGKRIADDEVIRCAEMSRRHGMRFVKLYFMVGLPGETDEDFSAIVELATRVAKVLPTKVALSPFVPKPYTPLVNAALPAGNELRKRLRRLKQALRRIGNVTVTAGSVVEARVEAFLSLGGREVADVLEQGLGALRAEAKHFRQQRRE